MHGVTGSHFSGLYMKIYHCWLNFWSLSKLLSTNHFWNLLLILWRFEIFLGYRIKSNTSDPDYTKVGNALFSSFTAALNNLCKPLPILCSESYDTLHWFGVYLVRSCVFNLLSIALISVCIWLPSQISLRDFFLVDSSSESFSIYGLSIEAKMDSSSSALCSFYTELPSSNCAKVIISPVCS